ncbi:MAG: hypothetical protein RL081_2156 [Pseudomonadota bacterium]
MPAVAGRFVADLTTMPQQINLCTGLVKTQRERFTARTMLPALGVFVVLGGVLSAAAVWSLGQTAAGFRQTNEAQSAEIKNLQAAITQSRANATPVDVPSRGRAFGPDASGGAQYSGAGMGHVGESGFRAI